MHVLGLRAHAASRPAEAGTGMTATRRIFLAAGPAAAAACLLPACSDGDDAYARAAQETWRPARQVSGGVTQMHRELVRCATLAPSSHNTQCWKFRLGERRIAILPDVSRRCPAVDPDEHHLYVSLGSPPKAS